MEEQNFQKFDFTPPENQPVQEKKNLILPVLAAVAILFLGGLTGYILAPKQSAKNNGNITSSSIQKGKEFGTLKGDTAVGVVEEGGIDGEGTHHLTREGGPSQTAYLTSSVIDLDLFKGKKVQVWGETQKSQRAPWLMDVVGIKVIE
jgi:hypothetical protein